jgi:hypothetical protein
MKNFFVTTILMITSIVAFSQTIDTSNKNRFFPQRLHQPQSRYFRPIPDKFGFDNHQRGMQRGPQLPIPDSIYMKSGKVIMIFDANKIKQFIQNRRSKWMNL